jgi:RNA polymerase sigma-70 factor (ECF subfamily)
VVCRQLASRARTHVRAARPRFPVKRERGLEIAAAFFSASRSGDMQQLRSLLAEDVTVYADGGGKRPAANRPILGADEVIQLAAIARIYAASPSRIVRYGFINGFRASVTVEGDGPQTTALAIESNKIAAIYLCAIRTSSGITAV